MNLISKFGKVLVSSGESVLMQQYKKMYGHQIGKTSRSGHKAFAKIVDNKEVITGLDREGSVISKITRDIKDVRKNIGSGTSHTEIFKDGKLISVTDTRMATNFRKSTTHFADGSVTCRVWDCPNAIGTLKIINIPSVYAKGTNDIVVNTKMFKA